MTSGSAPAKVRYAVMRHRWESVTFLHWSYPVDTVRRLLPSSVQVEPWDGLAWVGLVLFRMYVQPPAGPSWNIVPPFPETNVRTYVVGTDGQPGVWFFSLDAASPSAVLAARTLYQLPYYRSAMSITERPELIRYTGIRRWPGRPAGAGYDITVAPGDALLPAQATEFDHYLTARFRLWNRNRGALLYTQVSHQPWPLRKAQPLELRQNLFETQGLPDPIGPPVVHFSPGVDVDIGPPRVARRLKRY
jgi:uncharacterized protein